MMDEAPAQVRRWVEQAKIALRKSGAKVILQDSDLLEYTPGNYCSGYFEGADSPEFACATGRPWEAWFPIFVHEYCHFEQWRDRRDWWDSLLFDGQEGLELAIEAWSGKIQATTTQIAYWCMTSAAAEIDCEKRVLKKISEHGLPINVRNYAKKANSYIAYYYAMPELGGWCNGERPYEVPAIMDLMPDHLDLTDREYWGLAVKTMDLYRDHCLHKKE